MPHLPNAFKDIIRLCFQSNLSVTCACVDDLFYLLFAHLRYKHVLNIRRQRNLVKLITAMRKALAG